MAAMNSEKACYWVALGVLVLGLSANYQEGGVQWSRQLARAAQVTATRVAARGAANVALARVMLGRDESARPVELATVLPAAAPAAISAEVQANTEFSIRRAEFARAQSRIAIEQVRLAKLDARLRREFSRKNARQVYVRLSGLSNQEIAVAALP